ncbi:hypothetical protein [Stenotrophomonas maltophilia]|uniref:hypothetical protein n=1 Tax=Stenotrophomonas maltophilia TaxID=40324 RepID=UPI001F34EE83|nr:hypothetical protein [Stenotrophomonas maltophilia]MCF3525777.1 hypothetical protein [Stenotrophomonas maltophilia]MCF3554946.1 hypothetical protein [Stenotrophomonas maltophilia]
MNRDFAANLVSYLELSSAWLIDTMRAHDMAVATEKIVESQRFTSLSHPVKVEDGPILTTAVEEGELSIPAYLYTGNEFARAIELVTGQPISENEGLRLPGVGTGPRRIEAIIARSGIISQFELWKKFAKPRRYPTDGAAAKSHEKLGRFYSNDEREMLEGVVKDRNRMTHEPNHLDDPTVRDLVDYTNKLHHLAKYVDKLHSSGVTATWHPTASQACSAKDA